VKAIRVNGLAFLFRTVLSLAKWRFLKGSEIAGTTVELGKLGLEDLLQNLGRCVSILEVKGF
jgi:hypothetical protein